MIINNCRLHVLQNNLTWIYRQIIFVKFMTDVYSFCDGFEIVPLNKLTDISLLGLRKFFRNHPIVPTFDPNFKLLCDNWVVFEHAFPVFSADEVAATVGFCAVGEL